MMFFAAYLALALELGRELGRLPGLMEQLRDGGKIRG
jgi:hypothetical protein